MNDTARIHDLLEKYQLSRPVPPEVQAFILQSRRSSLKRILKRYGRYGFILWLASLIGLALRSAGWKFSLVQCKVILACATTTAVAFSGAGTYKAGAYVYKHVIKPAIESWQERPSPPETPASPESKSTRAVPSQAAPVPGVPSKPPEKTGESAGKQPDAKPLIDIQGL